MTPSLRSPGGAEPKIHVVVNRSTEPIDFDAWAARYVRAVLAADRAMQDAAKEAA